jgi:hypothetical protein
MEARLDDYKDLKHKLDGIVPPGMVSTVTCCSTLFTVRYPAIPK